MFHKKTLLVIIQLHNSGTHGENVIIFYFWFDPKLVTVIFGDSLVDCLKTKQTETSLIDTGNALLWQSNSKTTLKISSVDSRNLWALGPPNQVFITIILKEVYLYTNTLIMQFS